MVKLRAFIFYVCLNAKWAQVHEDLCFKAIIGVWEMGVCTLAYTLHPPSWQKLKLQMGLVCCPNPPLCDIGVLSKCLLPRRDHFFYIFRTQKSWLLDIGMLNQGLHNNYYHNAMKCPTAFAQRGICTKVGFKYHLNTKNCAQCAVCKIINFRI